MEKNTAETTSPRALRMEERLEVGQEVIYEEGGYRARVRIVKNNSDAGADSFQIEILEVISEDSIIRLKPGNTQELYRTSDPEGLGNAHAVHNTVGWTLSPETADENQLQVGAEAKYYENDGLKVRFKVLADNGDDSHEDLEVEILEVISDPSGTGIAKGDIASLSKRIYQGGDQAFMLDMLKPELRVIKAQKITSLSQQIWARIKGIF